MDPILRLLAETAAIAGMMGGLCFLTFYSEPLRRRSHLFFLLGTGALSGLLFYDLLPEIIHTGGNLSLWVIGAVWLAYSLLHLPSMGLHSSKDGSHAHDGGHATVFFLSSMTLHCLASGMLLAIAQLTAMGSAVTSTGVESGFGRAVFFALLAHKGYESLTVASILIEKRLSRPAFLFSMLAYCLALPVGVALTMIFRAQFTQTVALVTASTAVGTLLGCLVYDFFLPSLGHVRRRFYHLGWIVLGLVATQWVMRFL